MSSSRDADSNPEAGQLKLPNAAYTVGWICALSTEHVAARVFLDQEHAGPPPTAPHDNNSYALGSIGEHNVAIAVMPSGEYGTASAAGVARDMLSSFPNIRIGLMVGIGGGAPNAKHDIRLGDVVVSEPGNGLGGVYQYDFGKNIQNEPFVHTRFLAPPPTVLLTAISSLKSTYEIDGHRLQEDIERILATKKRLRKKYGRPDAATDRLFKSEVVHSQDETCCSNINGIDPASLILRPARDEDEDDPAIHYGLIASGNSLVKDARFRDAVAKEKNVLCFEMEAGGLMNHFPCLVIRGICDYSDSHKNKDWQGYAAMTAAAYAKDLLHRISPIKVEAETPLADIISGVEEGVTTLVRSQRDKEEDDILKWLTPIDYAPQQSIFFRQRQEGTGQWLLDSDKFQEWLSGESHTLFCPGIPGAGKTVLTSFVVNHLQSKVHDTNVGIAYIYFNYKRRDEQQIDNVLESLVKQLAESQPSLPKTVHTLYQQHKEKRTRPSVDELTRVFQSLSLMFSKVYVAFDALDECEGRQRANILSQISQMQSSSRIYIFTTSRFIRDIQEQFNSCLVQEIRATPEDISSYITAHISQLPSCAQRSPSLLEEIKSSISEAVDGMFLLAQIYIQSLEDKLTPNNIRDALRLFKKYDAGSNEEDKIQVLGEAYDRAMERIDGQKEGLRMLARRAILWISCAKRRITTTELRHALAVKDGTLAFDPDDLPQTQDIVSVCAGLVAIEDGTNVIRLVHYTTEEYFRHALKKWFPQPQSEVTTTCVTYLSYEEFETGSCKRRSDFKARLKAYPFYEYAALNWGYHAREVQSVKRELVELLKSTTKVQSLYQVFVFEDPSFFPHEFERFTTGLHLAASYGVFEAVVQLLCDECIDIEAESRDDHKTPLRLAAENGHRSIVEHLIEKGAAIDTDNSPLCEAARNGHEAVVRLLINKGADIDLADSSGCTALTAAASGGHEAIVQLLLDRGADIEGTIGLEESSPLYEAASGGHEAVVQLLLNRGADIDNCAREFEISPVLYGAACGGHEAVVQLLLDRGADIKPDGGLELSRLLYWLAERGHKGVIQLLLDRSADIEPVREFTTSSSALYMAAIGGHKAVVQLLLDRGADGEATHWEGRTILCIAACSGYDAVVQLLLDKGADIEAADRFGQTALYLAAVNGHVSVAQILLERGANIEAVARGGYTPLLGAADKAQKETVQLLLNWAANIDAVDGKGNTALHLAIPLGDEVLICQLLDRGLNIDAVNSRGLTPLFKAVDWPQKAVAQLLLDRGARGGRDVVVQRFLREEGDDDG